MPAPDDQLSPASGPTRSGPGEDVLTRPAAAPFPRPGAGPPARAGRSRAPLLVAGIANGLWAALSTFLPVVAIAAAVTQIAAPRPALTDTLRYGLAAWLLGYGVPLRVTDYPMALIPLLLTALACWRVVRAGRNVVRAVKARGQGSWRVTASVAAAIAAPYAALGLGCAVLVNGSSGVSVSPSRAALTLGVFAGVGAGLGAGAATGATRRLWRRSAAVARDGVRAGVAGAMSLLAGGALASGVAIAAGGGSATRILHSYHAGLAGQAGLIAICLVYAPNVAVWASAFLAGPGFTLAAVPALPVFAGLPAKPLIGAAQLLLGVPVLAGLAAGLLLVHKPAVRRRVRSNWWTSLLVAALSGVSSGSSLALAGYVAAGSLGAGLLADLGQVGWQFPVISAVGITVGTLVGVNVGRLRSN